MSNSETIKKSEKLSMLQKLIFRILKHIQYGKLIIYDATGIHTFEGEKSNSTPEVMIKVHNLNVYQKILLNGSMAAGESYMEGEWETDDLTKLIEIIIVNTNIFSRLDGLLPKIINLLSRFTEIFKRNTKERSKKNILAHYDLGDDFFQTFLDPTMMYSCALYEPDDIALSQAAVKKIDAVCNQLKLAPSDRVLEIGTGWGGFAIHAAQHYGCKITTTTISDKQYAYVKNQIAVLGLTDKIELLNVDYRELSGSYDKLVSIEMIEAIGHKHFKIFFQQCNKLVKPNGLFFLQAILINDQVYSRAKNEIDFIRKYIFPGGCLPSTHTISQMIAEHTQFNLLHWRDIGPHYAKTLDSWLNNFNARVDEIRKQNFSEEFIRMWRYYFCYCSAAFRQQYITDIHALWRKGPQWSSI